MPEPEWFARTLDAELLAPILNRVPGHGEIHVTQVLRRERRAGQPIPRQPMCWAPNKIALDARPEPTWEEFVIAQRLIAVGWWACWVKFWFGTQEFCAAPGVRAVIPDGAVSKLSEIARGRAAVGGIWDVFAWKPGTPPLFLESKQYRSTDTISENQKLWMAATLDAGIPASSFCVVNYDAGKPEPRSSSRPAEAIAVSSGSPDARTIERSEPARRNRPLLRPKQRTGILDQVGGEPPAEVGPCSGINLDGSSCRNPGRYWVDGHLSCSRHHARYREA